MSRDLLLLFFRKEIRDLRTNRQLWPGYLFLPVLAIALPVLLLAGLPAVLASDASSDPAVRMLLDTAANDPRLRGATLLERMARLLVRDSALFYLFMPVVLAAGAAALALVREKEQRTLEPILATPLRDRELLWAKLIAVLGLPVLLTWAAALAGMAVTGIASSLLAGVVIGPTGGNLVGIFLLAPLLAAAGALAGIGVSARLGDSQAASQFTGLAVVPVTLLVVAVLGRPAMMSPLVGLGGGVIVLGIAALLFRRALTRIRREELLTGWR